jgi:thiol-disulfide isomerase/thioredoxin
MLRYVLSALPVILPLPVFAETPATNLTTVKVSFIEALDPKDTTSSQRFQEEYERAIDTGRELTEKRLASCGYELKTETSFYGASDPIKAKESGEKAASNQAWLIVGPRRSNHYVLLAKGAAETPSVSLMASSDSLNDLGPMHISLAPSNSVMAASAAREAKRQAKGKASYVSFLASECLNCRDFAAAFDKSAETIGLKKKAEVSLVGEQPDVAQLVEVIKKHKPSFVLLPNYSILSSYVVSKLAPVVPGVFFVGSDGWGDAKFGFVQNGPDISNARGFSVRGNPPVSEGLKGFDLGKRLIATGDASKLGSSSSLAILRVFDGLEKSLCRSKPKIREAFAKDFSLNGSRDFSNLWGVSIYEIRSGEMTFARSSKTQSRGKTKQ